MCAVKEQDEILEYGYISGLIESLEARKKELAAAIKRQLQVGESGVAGPYIVTRREVHRFDISQAEKALPGDTLRRCYVQKLDPKRVKSLATVEQYYQCLKGTDQLYIRQEKGEDE